MSLADNLGDIYLIRNLVTNKSYVGQVAHWVRAGVDIDGNTKHVRKGVDIRIRNHFNYATNNGSKINDHPKLYNAIRKYGVPSFASIRLETCPVEMLNEREMHWIRVFDSVNNGYNVTYGGQDRRPADVEKISKIVTDLWSNPEYREMQLSKKKRNNSLPHCINPVGKKVTGYNVKFQRNGVLYYKTFGVKEYKHLTLEQRLEEAIKWRDMKMIEANHGNNL